MIRYSTMQETIEDDENGSYLSFGLKAQDERSVLVFHDVFLEQSEAERCVDVFNKEQLDMIHLEQVIDDYLRYGEI